jgi:uncharacterized Ntn-hydrolase superfamily protein
MPAVRQTVADVVALRCQRCAVARDASIAVSHTIEPDDARGVGSPLVVRTQARAGEVHMWWILAAGQAQATWSVVASDSATGEIGGAGTSCVGSLDLTILFGPAPGAGAIHAQALINTQGRDRGAELLANGATPEQVITEITSASFDGAASSRQYGVVDLLGNAAAYTGAQNGDWAGHRTGVDGTFTYSVQGNILTGPEVVDRSEVGFLDPDSCDLAERLMVGLESGSAAGEGDSRCTDDGIPSDSAFLGVVDLSGQPVVHLTVTGTAPDDPLILLRARFDAWRAKHPCPEPEPPPADTDTPVPVDTAEPPVIDTGPAPAPSVPPESTAPTSACGCAQAPTAPWLALVGALVAGSRRRRSGQRSVAADSAWSATATGSA